MIYGFLSGSHTDSIATLLSSSSKHLWGIHEISYKAAPIIDGSLIGALISPFGFALPLLAVSSLLKPGPLIVGAVFRCIPAFAIGALTYWLTPKDVPPFFIGIGLGFSLITLGLVIWRMRQRSLLRHYEIWLNSHIDLDGDLS